MNKILSVITVCKNSERKIENCLRSCSDLEDVEQIVVDGNSSDKTLEIIEEISNSRKNLTLVREDKPAGIYSALNLGISLAIGKYILVLNSDDELVNFSQLVDDIKLQDSDIFVGRQLGLIDEKHLITIGFEKIKYGPVMKMPWPHGSMIVKKEFIDQVGSYNTAYRMSSDLDWVNKALLASPAIEYLDYDISIFSFGGVSTTSIYGPFESFKIFRVHGGSYIIGSLRLVRAVTIKIIAKFFGWKNLFYLKRLLRLKTGIWHYKNNKF